MRTAIPKEHVAAACGTESEPAVTTGAVRFVTQAGINQPAPDRFFGYGNGIFVAGDLTELGVGNVQVRELISEDLKDPLVNAVGGGVG